MPLNVYSQDLHENKVTSASNLQTLSTLTFLPVHLFVFILKHAEIFTSMSRTQATLDVFERQLMGSTLQVNSDGVPRANGDGVQLL